MTKGVDVAFMDGGEDISVGKDSDVDARVPVRRGRNYSRIT
jgi:hypothetical protein